MDLNKIKEQIEFYFSDSNYAKDKFLQETAIKNNKCIPIGIITSFQRMRNLNATVELIKEATKDSDVVEIVEDSLKKIETKEYLEYRMDKSVNKKIVHMRGFDLNAALDDLKAVLKNHCNPVKIIMRRDSEKKFKGTCFVEFSTVEEAENALGIKIEAYRPDDDENETNKKAKIDPVFIEIIRKDDYLNTKTRDPKKSRDERFVDKVKSDFIPKLFKYECDDSLTIADIKELVKNAAFVDSKQKIIRMKYREDWTENEFEKEEKKIKLNKLPEVESREYVQNLQIKKAPRNK